MSRLEHGRRVIDQMIDTLGAGSKDIDCVNHVIDQAQKATELQAKVEELKEVIQQAFFELTHPEESYAIHKAHETLDKALKGVEG
ncbi:hypothetical protein [Oceanobacillus kimchii]|uniref:Uncharacterized protein n=1 Tax=Oceanobacillus kimchii TaxID=746691 RepID=A0ABQ5TH47_9BACI|nr:hypothetical protein [Oceanobacillus kimchii]GLO66201.1 hypothetical protein MACH08_19850 [Oceanobacillus kimchii]